MSYLTTTLTYLRARFGHDQEGASMVEYGLLVAFIAIIALVGVQMLGGGLNTLFQNVTGEINDAGSLPG